MRRPVSVIWDLEEDVDGNYVHIVVEHGVSQDEVDDVMRDPTNPTVESDLIGATDHIWMDADRPPPGRGLGACLG